MNGTSLLAFLRLPFSCLECFSINSSLNYIREPWDWNDFSSELKIVLSNIIHSSNLKVLVLEGLTNVPTTFFLYIVHLSALGLHSVSTDDFGYENSSSPTRTWAASKGVSPATSHWHVVNLLVIYRRMWRLREYSEDRLRYACSTRSPSFSYFSLKQDIKVRPGWYSCHWRAVYASSSVALPSLTRTFVSCLRCLSWWVQCRIPCDTRTPGIQHFFQW